MLINLFIYQRHLLIIIFIKSILRQDFQDKQIMFHLLPTIPIEISNNRNSILQPVNIS